MGTVTTRPPGYVRFTERQRRRYAARAPRATSVSASRAPYVPRMLSLTPASISREAGGLRGLIVDVHPGGGVNPVNSIAPLKETANGSNRHAHAKPQRQTPARGYSR